jgi:hypothetical protein
VEFQFMTSGLAAEGATLGGFVFSISSAKLTRNLSKTGEETTGAKAPTFDVAFRHG